MGAVEHSRIHVWTQHLELFRNTATDQAIAAKPKPAERDAWGGNAKVNSPTMKGTERHDKDGVWIHKTYFKK